MKLLGIVVFALAAVGCNLLQALEGGSGAGGASSSTGGTGGAAPQGVHCGVDPDTSATLCLGISLCPGLTVDQEVFPQCGFHVKGNAIAVECSCGGSLCSLGPSATCAAVKQLLAQQNKGTVCAQVSAGVCTQGTPGAAASSGSGSGSCNTVCRADCAGDPTCIQACGC